MTLKIPIHNSKVYIVDTSSLIFRAFYAIPNLSSPKGEPVNALYGFINMTLKLLAEKKPEHIIFCQDSKTKGERYKIYPAYKANRGEMPESLVPQMSLIAEFIDYMGFPRLQVEGVEADDIIGTLAHKLSHQDNQVVIVSGDKDFAQLISSKISMYDTMKDIFYDREAVFSKWNVYPEQMIDYLALVGDSSDHIPGVTGIGPKTASELLMKFKSLDGIYQNINQVKGANQKKLLEGKEMAYLSQKLVRINTETPLSIDLNSLLPRQMDKQKILTFFERYNFRSLAQIFDKLGSSADQRIIYSVTSNLKKIEYNITNAEAFFNSCHDILWIDMTNASELAISDRDRVIVIPISEISRYLDILAKTKLAGSNLKTLAHKIKLPKLKVYWDNLIAAYVALSEQSLELGGLLKKYLDKDLNQFGSQIEAQIALADALKAQAESQIKIIQDVELPLLEILYDMELRGVLLDTDWLD